jgi:hypothetical protein
MKVVPLSETWRYFPSPTPTPRPLATPTPLATPAPTYIPLEVPKPPIEVAKPESIIAPEHTVAALVIFGLIFGEMLVWLIGLAPALVYRYFIYKRPVEKSKVLIRLGPIIVVLMFALPIVLGIVISGKPGPPAILPWVVIYFLGKWIMTRNPAQ